MLVLGLLMLSIKEMQSSHVLVSDAHVVEIVDQSSARFTFVMFVRFADTFAVLVSAILPEIY